MSIPHLIPIPLRGGMITIPPGRPSFPAVAIFAAVANPAQSLLSGAVEPSIGAYLICYGGAVLLAVLTAWVAGRTPPSPRTARVWGVGAGTAGLLISMTTMPAAANVVLAIAAGVIIGVTLARKARSSSRPH